MIPVDLKRKGSLVADFVVYHRDHGPVTAVWMVPETHVDAEGARYRSAILAASAERKAAHDLPDWAWDIIRRHRMPRAFSEEVAAAARTDERIAADMDGA